jgi:hypothetical protein
VIAVAGTALAAPGAMPDSILYPVKQLEEGAQLLVTPASDRLAVELAQADQRLREARVMAGSHKPLLAIDSLQAFRLRLNDAAASLASSDPQRAQQEIARMRVDLDAVERANAKDDDDDSAVRRLVTDSAGDLDRIGDTGSDTPAPTLVVGTEATPAPSPTSHPKPVVKPAPTHDGGNDERH